MGVPKFYRWLSERYPLINQAVTPDLHPPLDGLYLDMNGILHNATHGADIDPTQPYNLDECVIRIFRYIDKLVRIAQPRKVLYMALDGVAPRAKLNQQRQRRFKSAREAAKDESVPKEGKFDSNAITPGTEFMAAMTPHMKYFIQKKMTEDELWKDLQVVYSGHDVPGEGEHKIMAFIRAMKMMPDYDPSFSHCISGLDADLIFLSLVVHEPHVVLLREEVVFGPQQNKKMNRPMHIVSDAFQFLHISILRDYLRFEFEPSFPPGTFDLELVVDDFVLMCMLVGNDFVPHLPSMDIAEGALDLMIDLHKQLIGKGHLRLTDGRGGINFANFGLLLARLAENESSVFRERQRNMKKYLKQMKMRLGASKFKEALGSLAARAKENEDNDYDVEEEDDYNTNGNEDSEGGSDKEYIGNENNFDSAYKSQYYKDKFGNMMDAMDQKRLLCKYYLEALTWILQYYYQGVQSWSSFYPFYYAPLVSDFSSFDLEGLASEIKFVLGRPFLPCEQLLSVLPPQSAALVPKPLDSLMLDTKSPIIDFYPTEFKEDYNGKKNDWEAIILIPFVDENRLIQALTPYYEKYGLHELPRNQFGRDIVFIVNETAETRTVQSSLPSVFTDISSSTVISKEYQLPPIPGDGMYIPRPNARTKVPIAGFPHVMIQPVVPKLFVPGGVNIFGRVTDKATIVLTVAAPEDPVLREAIISASLLNEMVLEDEKEKLDYNQTGLRDSYISNIQKYADSVCGKVVYTDWPYFQQALVTHLSTAHFQFSSNKPAMQHKLEKKWVHDLNAMKGSFRSSRAVVFADVEYANSTSKSSTISSLSLLCHFKPFSGLTRASNGDLVKLFKKEVTAAPAQLTALFGALPTDERYEEKHFDEIEIEIEFPHGSFVVYLGKDEFFGGLGSVCGYKSNSVLSAAFKCYREDDSIFCKNMVKDLENKSYFPFWDAARSAGISTRTLSKVTSSMFARPGNKDLGLGLNFKKKELLVSGMVKYSMDDRGQDKWEYSQDAIDMIKEYKTKFPEVFQLVEQDADARFLEFNDFFKNKTAKNGGSNSQSATEYVDSVALWLKQHPLSLLPLVSKNSVVLPRSTIVLIQNEIDTRLSGAVAESVNKDVEIKDCYKPKQEVQWSPSDSSGFNLGDRVSYLGGLAGVPFGMRGVVVGIHPFDDQVGTNGDGDINAEIEAKEDKQDSKRLLIDVVFDERLICGTSLGSQCAESRGLTLGSKSLLNLTEFYVNQRKSRSKKPKNWAKAVGSNDKNLKASKQSTQKEKHDVHNQKQKPKQNTSSDKRSTVKETNGMLEEKSRPLKALSKSSSVDKLEQKANGDVIVEFWNDLMNKTTHNHGPSQQEAALSPPPLKLLSNPVPGSAANANVSLKGSKSKSKKNSGSQTVTTLPPQYFAYMATTSSEALQAPVRIDQNIPPATGSQHVRGKASKPSPSSSSKGKSSTIWKKVEQ